MGASAVEVRNLVKDFRAVRALDGLDLAVRHGELYGLVGPNGSGKTTLIRILMGLERASGGTARVLGREEGAARAEIGYMPQEEAIYGDLSVAENLDFFAGLYGVDADERVGDVLGFVRLLEARDRVVGELSGGMRRRVSLACALVHGPRCLLLDEPTAGVDPVLRREFWDGFHELAERGGSLLITTHHLEEARRCDRVGLLWKGRLLTEAPPDELLRGAGADSLEDAFLFHLRRAGLGA